MGMVKTDEQNYINIANAIREKTGSTDTFTPGEMDDAILAIPTGGAGLTEEVKYALLQIAEKVAYTDDQGQTYYQALYDAFYPSAGLVSISAVFTQGSSVIYTTDSLDTLKQYLTVTATYEDSSTAEITTYTLSGTLTEGTSTITASYGGKTDTFNVIVTLDTTAEIVTENEMLVHHTSSPYYTTKSKTNAGITKKYEMASATNILYPAGIIPTDAYTSLVSGYDAAILVVYDENGDPVNYVDEVKTNDFYRWSQNVNGTMTEYSQSWTLNNPYKKIAFSLDMRYLDDAYMYDKTTGDVWFAGRNTPYYGMSNISEAL